MAERFISRVEGGWWVRFHREMKTVKQKTFYDSRHGSSEAALKSAVKWRDQTLRRLSLKHGFSVKGLSVRSKDARNTSGTIGVNLAGRASETPKWQAVVCLSDHANPKRVTRSIKRYGYVAAYRQACRIRAKLAGVAYVEADPPAPPEWLKEWAKTHGVILQDESEP